MSNKHKETLNNINQSWTDIYHFLHYVHKENISHQSIRLLQFIEKNEEATIGNLATYLGISHNTASEHIKRLIKKGYVLKQRSIKDERTVLVILTLEGKKIMKRNTQLDEDKLNQVLEELDASDIELIENAFLILSKKVKKCFI